MIKVLKRIKGFMFIEIILISCWIFGLSLVSPLITKITGIELSVTIIAVIDIMRRLTSLVSSILRHVRMRHKYIMLIVSVSLNAIGLSTYSFIDDSVFIILITFTMILSSLSMMTFYTDYDVVLSRLLSTEDLRDYMHLERTTHAIVGVIGLSSSILISSISQMAVVYIAVCLMLASVSMMVSQYRNHYYKMELEDY
jgi:hypothetical protein